MQRKLTALSKFFDIVDKLESFICGGALTCLMVVVLMQVLCRLLAISVPWTEETTRFFFLWMMFIAVAAGFNRAESARVIICVAKFPRVLQKICAVGYFVVSIGFFLFMAIYGYKLAMQKFAINEMATAIAMPMGFIMLCVPISGVLGVIGTIQSMLEYSHLVYTGGDNSTIGVEDSAK